MSSVGRKKRLYGKPATEEEIAQEVASLLLGDQDRKIKPLSVSDVAQTLELSRVTVYKYVAKAVKLNYLQLDDDGNPILPQETETEEFSRFDELHTITNDPLVKEWVQDLHTRKQGGKVTTYKERIRSLEVVCNTLKINPRALIKSQKQTETYMKNFIEMYRDGSTDERKINRKGVRFLSKVQRVCESVGLSINIIESLKRKMDDEQQKRAEDRIKTKAYKTSQGIRDFCGFYGITWKRGTGGVMSQRVVGHGKYADVKLTTSQLEQATEYIKKKWGVDSDVFRWFWIGIESCSRFNAMLSMSLDYDKHVSPNGLKTTYLMKAYESKTKHLKGGIWTKYVTRSETQQSIDALKSRHGIKIYDINHMQAQSEEKKFQKCVFIKTMNESMIEIFLYLGITNLYFYEHTNHVLRHIGAHYWLALLNYDYGKVALIGGWHTIDELRKSYGEMPPEKLFEAIDGRD